jgi:hypothetical protein
MAIFSSEYAFDDDGEIGGEGEVFIFLISWR